MQGGFLADVDTSGNALHLGLGHDNGGSYHSLSSLSNNFVVDDKNGVTLASTSTNKVLPFYFPNALITLGNGLGCPPQNPLSLPSLGNGLTVLDCDSSNGFNVNELSANTNILTLSSNNTNELVVTKGGTFPTVAGLTTGGLTGIVADFTSNGDLTLQHADITVQNLLTPSLAGTFRVTIYLGVTTSATTSTTPSVCILWTDRSTNLPMQTIVISSITNGSTTSYGQATLMVDAKAGVAIQYATGANCTSGTSYASSPANTMLYKIRARVEAN